MEQEPREVRLPLMVSKREVEAIDAWRYANHIPTRAEAIRRLIERGLQAEAALHAPQLSDSEVEAKIAKARKAKGPGA